MLREFFASWKWFFCSAILYKFERCHQSLSTNIAYHWQLFKLVEFVVQDVAHFSASFDELVFLEIPNRCHSCSTNHGSVRVRLCVIEVSASLRDCIHDLCAGDYCTQWYDSAIDPFAERKDVRH